MGSVIFITYLSWRLFLWTGSKPLAGHFIIQSKRPASSIHRHRMGLWFLQVRRKNGCGDIAIVTRYAYLTNPFRILKPWRICPLLEANGSELPFQHILSWQGHETFPATLRRKKKEFALLLPVLLQLWLSTSSSAFYFFAKPKVGMIDQERFVDRTLDNGK